MSDNSVFALFVATLFVSMGLLALASMGMYAGAVKPLIANFPTQDNRVGGTNVLVGNHIASLVTGNTVAYCNGPSCVVMGQQVPGTAVGSGANYVCDGRVCVITGSTTNPQLANNPGIAPGQGAGNKPKPVAGKKPIPVAGPTPGANTPKPGVPRVDDSACKAEALRQYPLRQTSAWGGAVSDSQRVGVYRDCMSRMVLAKK